MSLVTRKVQDHTQTETISGVESSLGTIKGSNVFDPIYISARTRLFPTTHHCDLFLLSTFGGLEH